MLKLAAVRLRPAMILVALLGGYGAAAAETLVVALGSSSTAGKGVGPGQTYPAQLQAMLNARGLHVRIINAGLNGDTSSGMLSRLDAAVPQSTRVAILQAGTNDAGEEGHRENIAEIIKRLQARSIKVVLFHTALMLDLRGQYSQADGHHLTSAGYQVLAARLLPVIERVVRR